MSVVVLDQMRSVTAVDNGPSTSVTVSQAGMQGPQGNPTIVNGKSGASITLNSADVGAVALSVVGVANGVPSLDSSALVPIAQLPLSGLAGNFVDLATAQTVNGVKTFGSIPVGPASDPTTANQLARKSYVDQKLSLSGGTMTGALTLAADPSSNLQAATKQYVDGLVQGLSTKPSCVAATTGTLPANTYNNGASGVGATLTGTANGALAAQDGVTLTAGQNLLVKNEATAANNGIYVVTQVGDGTHPYILTRHVDMDATGEIGGAFTFVETGTTNAGSGWVVATAPPIVVGTGAINWTQFSGAGEITAGTGLTKTGNTIALSTPVSVANGGTGSATQNFVDLTTTQTVAGAKTLNNNLTMNNVQLISNRSADSSAINITYSTTTNATNSAIAYTGVDATGRVLSAQVTGDTVGRLLVDVNGALSWGSGTAGRDTTLSRTAAGVLTLGSNLLVSSTLKTGSNITLGQTTTLGSGGVGVLELANAGTTPTANPTGGGVLYAKQGVPIWRDPSGNTSGMVRYYSALCTSNLASWTVETDVPGLSTNVVILGNNATVEVSLVVDAASGTSACAINAWLNWAGSDITTTVLTFQGLTGDRNTTSQQWLLTGLTAGTYVAKIRAACTASGSANTIRNGHTNMIITVVEN